MTSPVPVWRGARTKPRGIAGKDPGGAESVLRSAQRRTSWRWRQSAANPSPNAEFPANREKYREYPRIYAFRTDSRPDSARTFGHLRENSLRTGTGNFLRPNRELIRENREFEPRTGNGERQSPEPAFERFSGGPKLDWLAWLPSTCDRVLDFGIDLRRRRFGTVGDAKVTGYRRSPEDDLSLYALKGAPGLWPEEWIHPI